MNIVLFKCSINLSGTLLIWGIFNKDSNNQSGISNRLVLSTSLHLKLGFFKIYAATSYQTNLCQQWFLMSCLISEVIGFHLKNTILTSFLPFTSRHQPIINIKMWITCVKICETTKHLVSRTQHRNSQSIKKLHLSSHLPLKTAICFLSISVGLSHSKLKRKILFNRISLPIKNFR